MVFYRKYRPQNIQDLDSEAVRRKLYSVLSASAPTFIQVPHAFLFTGSKGLGKTSTARIVAKVINCTNRKDTTGKDIEPCNMCDSCLSITKGTNLDVFEIDAASNRGIDEIRDLKEKIRLAPVAAKKKIYIIDEVHMLTSEAFNALLKTLEEPPMHAVFILCTTELHKIPATIMSRCFQMFFKKATEEELVHAFKRIVKGEGLTVSDDVLYRIAKLADGGFRDGTKILEELVALSSGGEITADFFEGIYQVTNTGQKITSLLQAIENKDLSASLAIVSQVAQEGGDMSYFFAELISKLHLLMLQQAGITLDEKIETVLVLSDLQAILQLFSRVGSEMKYSVIPSLPLELALVEWCRGNYEERIVQREPSDIQTDTHVTVAGLRKQVGNMAKERAVRGETKDQATEKEKADPDRVSILSYSATGEHSQEWIDSLWKNIISEMKNHNHMIAGVLRSCRIREYDRKVICIEAAAKFHKDKLEEAKTYRALQSVCEQLIGNPVEITIELKAQKQRKAGE